MRPTILLAAICLILLGSDLAVAGAPVDLVPHRAIYAMRLAPGGNGSGGRGSGINGLDGRLVLTYDESCEGWEVQQLMAYRLWRDNGDEFESAVSFSSWESKDGHDYRFTVRTLHNRALAEELLGLAEIPTLGAAGSATYTKPDGREVALPAGTVFSNRFIIDLINAARDGKQTLERVVFDGADLDGPMQVSAFIGRAEAGKAVGDLPLTDRPGWRMRLAYFKTESQAALPDFEIEARLLDNGVATELVFDYGTFAIQNELESVEPLTRARCEDKT